MTTTQTSSTTDTLVVIPASTTTSQEIPQQSRHTKALVVSGMLTALVVAAAAGGFAYLARDDAPPATLPTVVGTIEDNSAVLHGGAGQLATVDGLPVRAGSTSTTGTGSTGTTDPSIAHGSGDGVVTSSGAVHG